MASEGGAAGYGTVFEVTAAGAVTLLHSFAGGTTDGASPYGSLVQGSDGNFYGVTEAGGANDLGTVFELTPDGTETLLYPFAGGATDGASPYGSLIQASDGNFYGMSSEGGAYGLSTIFQISSAGESVLYSFGAISSDGASPQYGNLIQGSDGNLYGLTFGGGGAGGGQGTGYGTVFKITLSGTETVLHAFMGATDGADPWGSLIQGSDGNFYGMTATAGTNGNGTVFSITPAGVESVLYAFAGGTTDGALPTGSLILASDGNFYGMTGAGGASSDGTLFKLTPAGAETVLQSFSATTDGSDPHGSLIQGTDGNFYGLTYGGGAGGGGTVFVYRLQ